MKEEVDLQCDVPGSLMEVTLNLLIESDMSLPELYKETGIPFYWLRQFKAGQFKSPSVNRVQYLYEFLSGKKVIH